MSSKKLNRRDFLKMSAAGAAAAALASCAPAATPTAAPKPTTAPTTAAPVATTAPVATKPPATAVPATAVPTKAPVTLEYLAWGDGTEKPAMDQLIALYKTQTGNSINFNPIADPNNNFYVKLQTMIAGGTPPDISSFQGWEWQVYADKGVLAEIDAYVAPAKMENVYRKDIKGIMDSTVRKGKTYLVPLQIATMVMLYNKKFFADAGVPVPTKDWTFEQFIETATKLTNLKDEKNKKFGIQGNGASWFRDIHWIRSTGKAEFDSITDPKKATFNTKEIIDIVQIMANDIYNKLKIAPTAADQSGGTNTIDTGNCAMKYEGAWYLPTLNNADLRAQNKALDIDVVLMPKGKDTANRWHRGWAEGIALLKGKKVDDAWKFAQLAGSGDGNKLYSKVTGRLPNDLEVAKSWWVPLAKETWGISNGQAFIDAFTSTQIDVISGVPRSKMNAEAVKPTGWDVLTANKGNAVDVLPKVDAAVQKLLDEYWAANK
jgi:multiple sugar transport system substrate-binding protein